MAVCRSDVAVVLQRAASRCSTSSVYTAKLAVCQQSCAGASAGGAEGKVGSRERIVRTQSQQGALINAFSVYKVSVELSVDPERSDANLLASLGPLLAWGRLGRKRAEAIIWLWQSCLVKPAEAGLRPQVRYVKAVVVSMEGIGRTRQAGNTDVYSIWLKRLILPD